MPDSRHLSFLSLSISSSYFLLLLPDYSTLNPWLPGLTNLFEFSFLSFIRYAVPRDPGTGQWLMKKGNRARAFGLDLKLSWKRRLMVLNGRASTVEYFAPKLGSKSQIPAPVFLAWA